DVRRLLQFRSSLGPIEHRNGAGDREPRAGRTDGRSAGAGGPAARVSGYIGLEGELAMDRAGRRPAGRACEGTRIGIWAPAAGGAAVMAADRLAAVSRGVHFRAGNRPTE